MAEPVKWRIEVQRDKPYSGKVWVNDQDISCEVVRAEVSIEPGQSRLILEIAPSSLVAGGWVEEYTPFVNRDTMRVRRVETPRE